jgi:thymidylate synthase
MALALPRLCEYIETEGRVTRPRNMLTKELPHLTFEITNPYDTLCFGIGRKMNVAFAAVEALEVMGGVSVPELKIRVNPTVEQFMNGDDFHGAYGPRIQDSVLAVWDTLRRDPDSRQAVMTIFQSERDLRAPHGTKDIPCTVALHYLIRDGALEAHTYMRSNDVWWGTTYDVFVFTQLQITLARLLKVEVGSYFHTATSLHMYERDFGKWRELTEPKVLDFQPRGVGGAADTPATVQTVAQTILYGDPWPAEQLTQSERWYFEVVHLGRKPVAR